MSDKEDLEREWYGTLPDAERAEVLKSLIAERGQTRRAEIEAQKQTDDNRQRTEGFHWVRALALATIIIGIATIGAATCHAIDVFGTPSVPAAMPRPAPSTSASAAPSGTSDAK